MVKEEKGGAPVVLAPEIPAAQVATYKPIKTGPVRLPFVAPKVVEEKKRYWFGTLPSAASFELWFRTKDRRRDDGTTWNKEDIPLAWVGACRHYQNLDVNGMSFVAFQERPTVSPTSGDQIMVPEPGCTVALEDEQIERVKFAVNDTFIRVMDEIDETGKPRTGSHIYMAHEPCIIEKLVTDGKTTYKVTAGPKNPFFNYNPRTDTPVSKYVYLLQVEKDFQRPSMADFFKNPPPAMLSE